MEALFLNYLFWYFHFLDEVIHYLFNYNSEYFIHEYLIQSIQSGKPLPLGKQYQTYSYEITRKNIQSISRCRAYRSYQRVRVALITYSNLYSYGNGNDGKLGHGDTK
jgi:hypothetical protein